MSGLRFIFYFLTAQPTAARFKFGTRFIIFFLLVLSVTRRRSPRTPTRPNDPNLRGWSHHQPITGHFSALCVIFRITMSYCVHVATLSWGACWRRSCFLWTFILPQATVIDLAINFRFVFVLLGTALLYFIDLFMDTCCFVGDLSQTDTGYQGSIYRGGMQRTPYRV